MREWSADLDGPSGSTGAQPSAEAIEAERCGECRQELGPTSQATGTGLCCSCRMDTPAIRRQAVVDIVKGKAFAVARATIFDEGRAAGRDEALREVVAWARSFRTRVDGDEPHDSQMLTRAVAMRRAADAIEAAFPTTGEKP